MTWLMDDNGNRCSAECWGSEDAAQKALDSLINCSDCSDCSDQNGTSKPFSPPIPKIENIHQVIYAAVSQPNALDMGAWHACKNTHCRAGWAVIKAGEAGRQLEEFFGTALAAKLIYRESGAPIHWDRFFDSNEDAMADMKRLADM